MENAAAKTPSPGIAFGLWLREHAEALTVAYLMALVIKCFCLDIYKIPSSSMEPTLMGDQHDAEGRVIAGGDKVMVSKIHYAVTDPERFDVVVFRFPLQQTKNYIKRLVGLPDEEIFIEHGNLFTRRRGSSDPRFHIARKPLGVQRSIWIAPWDMEEMMRSRDAFSRAWDATGSWSVTDGELRTFADGPSRDVAFELRQPVDDRTLRSASDPRLVGDLVLRMEVESEGDGTLTAGIDHLYGRCRMELHPSADGVLISETSSGVPVRTALAKSAIAAGKRHDVEFGVYDGSAYVRVDGRTCGTVTFLDAHGDASAERPRSSIRWGASGLLLKVRELAVGRDLFHRARDFTMDGPGHPLLILPGRYLVMGDNVPNSHDGRGWTKWTARLRDGREIVCEANETRPMGTPEGPVYHVNADRNGEAWDIPIGDVERGYPTQSAYYFVLQEYLLGRAFSVVLPPGRVKIIR